MVAETPKVAVFPFIQTNQPFSDSPVCGLPGKRAECEEHLW